MPMSLSKSKWVVLCAAALACEVPPAVTDGGGDSPDASVEDAGFVEDSGVVEDAGVEDSGVVDSGVVDSGVVDSGVVDSGVVDAGAVDAGPPDAGTPGNPDGGATLLRAMAANLTSGNLQSYDPGHGLRLMRGVSPDVVMIQEFNYGANNAAAFRQLLDQNFGTEFSYSRGTGQIPNGIISRWPIVASGEWQDTLSPNREFAWARIDVPGPIDLWAISVHLLTSNAGDRNSEATALRTAIQANVPARDYVLVGGDFNTNSRSENCFNTLSTVFVTSGPYPVDQDGNDGTNANRDKPYDHVLADRDLGAHQVRTVIGSSTYDAGLVLDSRVYTPLTEIAPAQFGDSSASNMQHMGVVKDFLIP